MGKSRLEDRGGSAVAFILSVALCMSQPRLWTTMRAQEGQENNVRWPSRLPKEVTQVQCHQNLGRSRY